MNSYSYRPIMLKNEFAPKPMKNNKPISAFRLVFFTVLFLTLLSGGVSYGIASQRDPSPQQNRIFENAMATWQIGVGAIVGLLGGKATDLLSSGDKPEEPEEPEEPEDPEE